MEVMPIQVLETKNWWSSKDVVKKKQTPERKKHLRFVIICLLQMCSDFPCGIVNVNRISWGIITFPQAAEKTQACGYFCSLGLS